MYEPAPVRSKKTSHIRSRKGCEPCRKRRRKVYAIANYYKCNEAKPICSRCEQIGDACVYAKTVLHFRDASNWAAIKSRKARATSAETSSDHSSSSLVLVQTGRTAPSSRSTSTGSSHTDDDVFDARATFQSLAPTKYRATSQQPHMELLHQSLEVLPAADRLYLSHFVNHTIHILPPNLRILCEDTSRTAATNHAVMALSAANLAMLLGSPQPGRTGLPRWPDSAHIINALSHVGTALSSAKSCERIDVATAIIVQLLLSFVQVEIGDVDGFGRYLRSIEKYLCIEGASLYSEELVHDITNLRPLTNAFSNPFCSQRSHLRDLRASRPSLNRKLTDAEALVRSRFIGSDAIELNIRIMLFTALQTNAGNPSRALRAIIRHYRLLGVHAIEDEVLAGPSIRFAEECRRARQDLKQLAEDLRALETPRVLSSLPILNKHNTLSVAPVGPGTDIEDTPLRFQSHDDAMDAADYVFARALCEEAPFFLIPGSKSAKGLPRRWIRLLLRIVAGLDLSQCAQRNKYRRGILDMLFCFTFFVNDAHINSLVNDLIDNLLALGESWEDCNSSFAVTRAILHAAKYYQDQGFKLFMASIQSPIDDPDCAINGRTKLITLYGQNAAGQPLDYFAKIKLRP